MRHLHDSSGTCHPPQARGGVAHGTPNERAALRRWADAIAAQDDDALGALRHRDWTMDYPQSGERLRGHANDRAISITGRAGDRALSHSASSARKTDGL